MVSVLLFTKESSQFDLVPKWWMQFMDDHGGRKIFDTPEAINTIMRPYGCTFRTTLGQKEQWGDRYLDFEKDDDAVMFMLRFQK